MLDNLKSLGLFKGFFLVLLPLCFVFFCIASALDGNLGYDLPGYLYGFGAVYSAIALVILFNRNTK